jgi:hypothetical protein
MIRTIRTVAMATTAIGVGAVGVTMVFVAWAATNIKPKH